MTITSPAFPPGGTIPDQFSRLGGDHSPPLEIRDVPREARSLALIMDDPDAPTGLFTHWVVFNLDPVDQQIPEGAELAKTPQGQTGWGESHYGGPRPPSGEHRYFFRVFALDRRLDLHAGVDRKTVDEAIEGHVIAKAELLSRFAASNN